MPTETETFIVNPYIAGVPVKDPAMFFGREDVYAWLRQHLRGKYQDNIIVLYGERRTGKTSILYQMKERLGDDHYVPILLDLQGMDLEGMDGLLWEVARKIALGLRGVEGVPLLDRPARRDFEKNPREQFENIFLPPVIAALGGRHLLLMFDETNRLEEKVQVGELPPDVCNYLRALTQHTNYLDFIFALGSRVEEARRSSELFDLAVYRKISFLDPDFAEDLITRPVSKYYAYTRPAIERILRLTAGHPYYTQLLCHNLFTYWNDHKPKQLDVADVEAVLPDAMEQSTPNLQFVWEASTPVERAILAALADTAPRYRAGVMRRNVDRALRKAKLYPPAGEVTTGLKTLFERDVINNQEPYEFRVGLLQRWLREFKQLAWVREELGKVAKEWEHHERQRQAKTPVERVRRWTALVLAGLLLGVLIYTGILVQNLQETREQSMAALDAAEALRLTEVAQLEATIIAASTEVAAAEAEAEGNPQEVAQIRATAQAAEAMAAIALARVTEVSQKEATAIAAVTEAVRLDQAGQEAAAAVAQATATAAQAEAEALGSITPVPSDTPLPPDTATPTPSPTATPRPIFTPTPAIRGRLAIPIYNGERYDIHIYAVPNGGLLGKIRDARQPSFRKTDGQLAVNAEEDRAIWIYDADGLNGRSVSFSTGDSHPAWQPDGQGLVYNNNRTFFRDGRFVWSIFVQDTINQPASSQDVQRLAGDILDAFSPLYPLWAVDDQIIFYACNYWLAGGGGQCGVWRTKSTATIDGDGFCLPESVTSQQEIPTDTHDRRLLVMGNNEGNWEVYLGSIEGGPLTNLSDHPTNDGLGTFSPDGRWVAFISSRDGQWGIWTIPVIGGEATRLPINDLRFGNGDRNWTTERISWGP